MPSRVSPAAVASVSLLLATVAVMALAELGVGPGAGRPQAPAAVGPAATGTGSPSAAASSSPSSRRAPDPVPGTRPPQPATTLSPCPAAGDPTPLRVLSFNIHGGVDNRNDYDLDRVVEEIRGWDPDVVLLQEVHRFRPLSGFEEQPEVLGARLGLEHVFGQNFSRRAKVAGYPRRRTGTAVLSRFPVLGHENTALPTLPGLEQRGLLRATLDVEGRAVDVYDTHLQPGGTTIRVLQVSAIERIVRERAARTGRPFLLGGDFNSEPDSAPMQLATTFATDPWPEVGVGVGETVRPRQPRFRVDYVLHGPGWRATEARTLLSLVSDHRALLVDLELEAGGTACS